jgi:hypothetical protein
VEKSSSLPIPFLGPHRALTIARPPIHSMTAGHGLANTRKKAAPKGPVEIHLRQKGTASEGAVISRGRRPLPLCQRQERSPKGEATHSIALVFAVIFYSSFSAQKSHVKSQNHLTHYQPTTSAWHVSYPQPAILYIEIKTNKPWRLSGANLLIRSILDATHLL